MSCDRVAIVTGGGSGIGRSVALALAADGYRVVIAGRTATLLDETVAQAKLPDDHMLSHIADVTDEGAVDSLFAAALAAFGRVDLLFNNAGVAAAQTPIEETSLADWHRVLQTNVTGTFLCTRAAFRVMKAQDPRGGRIINNGSVSAQVPRPDSIAYAAAKHAVTGITRSSALDGRKFEIACAQIDIGNTATDMGNAMTLGVRQADGSIAPEPVFDVRHVARTVLHMANLPLEANMPFVTLMATGMPFLGRG